jgi:hypothetical protein
MKKCCNEKVALQQEQHSSVATKHGNASAKEKLKHSLMRFKDRNAMKLNWMFVKEKNLL